MKFILSGNILHNFIIQFEEKKKLIVLFNIMPENSSKYAKDKLEEAEELIRQTTKYLPEPHFRYNPTIGLPRYAQVMISDTQGLLDHFLKKEKTTPKN